MTDNNNGGNEDKNKDKKGDKEFDKDKYKDRMVRALGAGQIAGDEDGKKANVVYSCQVCGKNFPTYQSYSEHFESMHQ